MLNPASPLGYLFTALEVHFHRARSEKGASAVEWVIISAIVVGICIAIAGVLSQALQDEAGQVGNKIKSQ
jgi:Flp pilus assembly pilin Flp